MKRLPWNVADFHDATGRFPEKDDLDRVNCPVAGSPGHRGCGVCSEHWLPMSMCNVCRSKSSNPALRLTPPPSVVPEPPAPQRLSLNLVAITNGALCDGRLYLCDTTGHHHFVVLRWQNGSNCFVTLDYRYHALPTVIYALPLPHSPAKAAA